MQQKKKSWHFDPATERSTALLSNPDAPYLLLDATPSDTQEVIHLYQKYPVPGYEVSSVQVIYNRKFNIKFNFYLEEQQNKKNNLAFASKWFSMSNLPLRQKTHDLLETISEPYTDPHYPDVKIIPGWHGTSPAALDSIFKIGYSNLAFTDSGFFGKGLYSAVEAEYSHRVYSKGALILNWVACFSALPVIDGDMSSLMGKANIGNYDAHFVPVVPQNPHNLNEKNYIPWKDNQKNQYTEIVVFQTAACLPRFLVTLQPTLAKPMPQNFIIPPAPLSSLEIGLACIRRSEFRAALGHLLKAELEANTLAPLFLFDLYSKSGLVGPIDVLKSKLYREQVARNFKVIQQQASLNDPNAQYVLGRCYEDGIGIPPNPDLAFKCYREAADQNHLFAQCQIGFFYEKGIGKPKNEQQAFAHYQLAADQGYGTAQSLLGFCYGNGVGVPKDRTKGRTCCESAANQGYAPAQSNLAEMYEYGEGGLLKDMQKAIRYYKLAAEQGHVTAQYTLGSLYADGNGIAVDRVKAAKWYQLAVNQGHPMAFEALTAQLVAIREDAKQQSAQMQSYKSVFAPLPAAKPAKGSPINEPTNPKDQENCVLQ